MDQNSKIKYMNILNNCKGVSYLLGTIAFGAAPTIENMKPSSVLTLNSRFHLLECWLDNCNWICKYFELEYLTLREGKNSHTLFFYKAPVLKKHLQQEENKNYLKQFGYGDELPNQLERLRENYNLKFPHEIGVFLGIPPLDVEAFIENDGKNYLLNGYWKVYYNLGIAIDTFHRFDESRMRVLNKCDRDNLLH